MKTLNEVCEILDVHKYTLFKYLKELKIKKIYNEKRERVLTDKDVQTLMKLKQNKRIGRPKSTDKKGLLEQKQETLELNNYRLGIA